jgi:hypothetical protein
VTSPLRRLDDRLVPRLAEFFDRLIPRPPDPEGPLPVILRLRRVDDRWTRRGPLALIREVPQLGAIAIAALVLANGVTVATRSDPARQAAQEAEQGGDPLPGDDRLTIGPQIGDSVDAYLESTRQRLRTAADGQPDAATVAVVSFAQYRTARQVQDILGPATVVRMFYRVPLPLPEPAPADVAVTDLLQDSKKEFLRVAIAHEKEIRNLQGVIDTNETDPVQKQADIAQQELLRRQVRHLRGDCACIYAVLVQTRLRVLADLLDRTGVRAVDAGAPGARTGDYEGYTALLPEEKVTVTGGNQE